MSKIKSILKTLRFPNLIMLAVVQFIVLHFIVLHYSFPFYLLITFSTICIALGGYLLNDIQDIAIDRHNGKLGLITNENEGEATIIAILMHVLGLIFGFFACKLSSLNLYPFFIAASITLVAYAFFLSKYKVIGNFVVSGLIALAILLAYFLAAKHKEISPELAFTKTIFVSVYAALGFLLNWIREVCKDLEDLEGDMAFQRYSIPILFGVAVSKFFIGFVLFGFIGIMLYLITFGKHSTFLQIYLVSFVVLLFSILIYVYRSKGIFDFKRLSFLLKILMFIGLLLPVVLYLR